MGGKIAGLLVDGELYLYPLTRPSAFEIAVCYSTFRNRVDASRILSDPYESTVNRYGEANDFPTQWLQRTEAAIGQMPFEVLKNIGVLDGSLVARRGHRILRNNHPRERG